MLGTTACPPLRIRVCPRPPRLASPRLFYMVHAQCSRIYFRPALLGSGHPRRVCVCSVGCETIRTVCLLLCSHSSGCTSPVTACSHVVAYISRLTGGYKPCVIPACIGDFRFGGFLASNKIDISGGITLGLFVVESNISDCCVECLKFAEIIRIT